MPDAAFVICRLSYTYVRREASGIGWQTDYPYREINLTTRFSELTKTRVSRDQDGTPNYYVVRLTDDTLFNCPVLVASDAGTIGFQDQEPERLREYLLKGGFFWVDDFWGTEAWDHWWRFKGAGATGFVIEDVPLDDLMLRGMFEISKVLRSRNRCSGGRTAVLVRRGADSEVVTARDRDAKRASWC